MGLDIYVGTLTRYYSGQWETVIQQWAREQGHDVRVERQNELPDFHHGAQELQRHVEAWRTQVASGLRAKLDVPLDWPEGLDLPYHTDKPAWDCYAALLLWAAYDEHPDEPRLRVAPDDLFADVAYRRSTAPGFKSRYSQLLDDTEMWLPAKFSFTIKAPDLARKEIGIGSSPMLLSQLQELNRRTWRVDDSTLSAWRREGAEHGAPLETSARFAYSIMHYRTSASVRQCLPMLLDY